MPALVERNQSLKREDISDLITMASADETPFFAMVRKGAAPSNTLYEWPVDVPSKPNIKGVVDEKDTNEFKNHSQKRTKLQGRVGIFEQTAMVSRLANAVSDVAGVGTKREFARNIAKAMEALKLSIETRCLCVSDSRADDGTDGAEFRGMGAWVASTAQSDLPVPADYLTPAGNIYSGASLANLSEGDLRDLLKSRWASVGAKSTLTGFVGPDFQAHVDDWSIYTDSVANKTVVRQFNGRATDTTVTSMVNFIKTSFGDVELYPHRYLFWTVDATGGAPTSIISDKGALLLDMSRVELRPLQNPTKHDLENKGGGPRALIDAILGLADLNPRAHCAVKPNA